MMNSSAKSVSAPNTPTEQTKYLHHNSVKKKDKHRKVHFPIDEMLVTCYLEPPDPWSKVFHSNVDCVVTAYVAACDKQGIKPITCILDQLQEFEANADKIDAEKRTFDLSIIGEKLSVKHCEALEEILRRVQFKLIDLEGCYLEDEGAAALFDMIEYYDSCCRLNISFTKHIDCRGWQACSRMVKKTSSLRHLNARSTGLNEQILLLLGRALRLGSNLLTLHLENCGIYGRCLVILVAALKLNTTLRELFLAENKITSSDGFQLGNLLRTNTHLELLDLSNNKLEDDGLINLMESLGQQSNTSGRGLSTLILWNNELTHRGMTFVAKAINSARTIKRLNLGSNAITSAGIVELKQSFICNQTLETIELENAKITSEGAVALADYIARSQIVQRLDLRGNNIDLCGLKALTHALKNNHSIISLQVDFTPLDLNESVKDREVEIQEINKYCQRNKEEKSSEPAQDIQLSTLFNGIFSRVLPISMNLMTKQSNDTDLQKEIEINFQSKELRKHGKSRFHVSPVQLEKEKRSFNENADKLLIMDGNSKTLPSIIPMRLFGGCPEDKNKVPEPLTDDVFTAENPTDLVANDSLLESSDLDDIETTKSAASQNLVMHRIKWLEDLSDSNKLESLSHVFNNKVLEQDGAGNHNSVSLCSENLSDLKIKIPQSLNIPCPENTASQESGNAVDNNLECSPNAEVGKITSKGLRLFLPLKNCTDLPPLDQKERRLSSPAVPTASTPPRRAHSLKCCKRLEGLDLLSSVPLSPTRLLEGFSFPEPPLDEVSANSQINMKSAQNVYMVH